MSPRSTWLVCLLLLVACDKPIPPTGPTTTVVTTIVTTGGPTNPQPGTGGGGGSGGLGGPRTPDPATGYLPLPTYGEGIVTQIAQSPTGIAQLAQSCYLQFGLASWSFIDSVVDRLRQQDARWGYACFQGSCLTPAQDAVAYHATSGQDVTGAIGIWVVTVIRNYCSAPVAQWRPVYDPAGTWSSRGRW